MNIETQFTLTANQVETAKVIADFLRNPQFHIHAAVEGWVLRVIKTDGTQIEADKFDHIVRMLEVAK